MKVDVETRTNIIIQKGKHQYRLSLPGQPVAREKLEIVREILQALVRKGDYVIISGSLPAGVGPEYYTGLVFMLKNWGAIVYLDTDGENLKNGILGEPYAIKPNLYELKRLLGKDVKTDTKLIEDVVEIIEKYNIEEVLLTLGKEGSYLITKNEKYMAKIPDVPVVSAVGAGDSFLAAYVLKRSEGLDRKEAFRWGNAAGTAAVMTPGTELCKKEDVLELLDKIEIIAL
ncbi:MAG TPA: 1-phosphofructokinase family hexose kinase [Thermotoga sp.]|nr:1-phosphofructokinase family hexose kinase [Thermotoga sp.]